MSINLPPHASFQAVKQRHAKLDLNWHYHPEVELILILKGRGWAHVGHSVHSFAAGELCILGSNVPHAWISTGPVEMIVVVFRPEVFQDSLASRYELAEVKRVLEKSERGLLLQGQLRKIVQKRTRRLISPAEDHSLRFVRLLEILALIGSRAPETYLSPDRHFRSVKPAARRRMRRVSSYVEQNAPGDVSHANAAALAGMTPTAFSRFFRKHIGKTFEDYVNDVRIGQVCIKLRDSENSITEVAFDCGFQSLANFNRRFRERLGTTPRLYRSRIRRSRD
jgi:AraC-like DNA-binding protein